MKIAYLIFAYKNPELLRRTIKILSSPNCAFFIHIDAKSSMEEFLELRGENVIFIDQRIPVYWGEFSGVQAILLLLRKAIHDARHYDYFALLSGSEYPLRSGQYVQSYFEDNNGYEFMNLVKVPAPGKPLSRINTLRFPSRKPVRRLLLRALAKIGLAQRDYRKYLGELEPYAGNTWWALTRDAGQYVLGFVEQNPRVVGFFEDMFAPEESFFHTIMGNNASFRAHIRRNLHYEDWSDQGSRPAMIGEQHIRYFAGNDKVMVGDAFGNGEVLFARKFSDANLDLLQEIDEIVRVKERVPAS